MSAWDLAAAVALLVAYGTGICLNSEYRQLAPWHSYHLNPSDDYPGYLLYPVQMLQTGAMVDDPFNDHRSMGGLGGEPFLQAMGLLFLPLTYIHLADPGLAHLAMGAALYSMARRRGWPRSLPGALTVLYVLVPTEAWNASAVSMPAVLLLCLYRTLADAPPGRPARRAAAVALPLAGALTLKFTVLPGALAVVGLAYLARMIAVRRRLPVLAEGVLVGAACLAFLLPWMIAEHRASGTPLYPFLGEGYRADTSIAIPHKQFGRTPEQFIAQTYYNLRKHAVTGCVLATLGALAAIALGRDRPRRRAATLGTLAGTTLTLAAYLVVFPWSAFYRYSYPFVILQVLVSFAAILGPDRRGGPTGALAAARRPLGWALLLAMMAILALDLRPVVRPALDSVRGGLSNRPFVPDELPDVYRRLQDSIPPGERALFVCDQNRYVSRPFLFDFRRGNLLIHDVPGCISPPPGIPLDSGGEALASYLRDQGIRYVITHRERDDLDEFLASWADTSESDGWIYSFKVNYAKLMTSLGELARSRLIVHEEADYLVIDLDSRRDEDASPRQPDAGTPPPDRDREEDAS